MHGDSSDGFAPDSLDATARPADRPTASGGIVLILSHRQSGDKRLATTFGDGTFYLMGVRPGDWTITVDPKCLDVLRATSESVSFRMASDLEGKTVSGIEIELR